MSDYILANEHILANVLLSLPVDSLIRFRSVSKTWRDLIDSSYFVDMHLRRSCIPNQTHRHPKIIVLVGGEVYTFDSVVKNGKKGYTASAKKLRIPDMEFKDYVLPETELAESCNGIVSLTYYTRDLVLWNPFTGSTLKCCQLTSPPDEFVRDRGCIQSAFGYDHLNDDYKLVKWSSDGYYDEESNNYYGYNLYEVCVYSFKHKSWKAITDAGKLDLDSDTRYLPDDCTFANGAMHWLMRNNLILAFDLGTYKFQKIPCAPIPVCKGYISKSLSSLNGCLCLGYTVSRGSSAYIWVMKEYGVETSWNKIACIDNPGIVLRYMTGVDYSEERGELMFQVGHWNLVMYDLKAKSLSCVVVNGEVKPCCVCACVGSFVNPLHLLASSFVNGLKRTIDLTPTCKFLVHLVI